MNDNHNFLYKILDGIKVDVQASKVMGIEITSETIKKYAKMRCNFEDCRHNKDGQCISQKDREVCVDVSRKVLCLEDRENGDFQK